MSPGEEVIGLEPARSALDELEFDTIGLEARDRAILRNVDCYRKSVRSAQQAAYSTPKDRLSVCPVGPDSVAEWPGSDPGGR